MKRAVMVAAVVAALLAGSIALACDGIPAATESVAVSSAAVGLTSSNYLIGTNERCALIQVQSNNIYFRLDSATATPVSTDYIGYVGDIIVIEYPSKFRAIRVSGDGYIRATYFQQ